MKLPLYQIDAFADAPFQGNPAAVCPLPYWLPDALLQAIALENNLSETAFFVGREGRYHIRWFTPATEVALCGHATLAAAYLIFSEQAALNAIMFDSRGGPLRVLRETDCLTLDFPALRAVRCDIPANIPLALGSTPIECFRTDIAFMAVFKDEQAIHSLKPDFRLLNSLGPRDVMVTAPGHACDFVSRYFAPACGIDEDPATGSAHCTLAPYWADRLGKASLCARQLSRRTGAFRCRIAGDRVLISGQARSYLTGAIDVAVT